MDVNHPPKLLHAIHQLRPITQHPIQRLPHTQYNSIEYLDTECLFLESIQSAISSKQNIAICSDSKTALLAVIEQLPPTVKKRVYTQGHPYKHELSDVNKYWINFQVLAYSPCITTATSFTREHFDIVFGLNTHQSLSARSFAQQLHRIRKIRSRKIVVFESVSKKSLIRHCCKMDSFFNRNSQSIEQIVSFKNNLKQISNSELTTTHANFVNELNNSIHGT